jgi:dsDNA-specific endonuclease/ATPase MutS2
LENLSASNDKNRAWENTKENIKSSAKDSLGLNELKQHKPRINVECLRFLDQRKQWLQNSNQNNVDNLNNIRRTASRLLRKKLTEYLKA